MMDVKEEMGSRKGDARRKKEREGNEKGRGKMGRMKENDK